MSGEHPDPAAQEHKRKEHEGQFDRLVLGHPLYEVDTDQIIGKKVAEMLELLPKGVPVECVSQVDEKNLNNPDTLVIEGFDAHRAGTNTLETGNFHNGPRDEPAAFMILQSILKNPPQEPAEETSLEEWQAYGRRLNELLGAELGKIPGLHGKEKRPLRQKLLHLVFWLSEREKSGETTGKYKGIDYPRVLDNDDLKVFSEIFNDLKYNIDSDDEGDKESRLFAASDELFNHLFDSSEGKRPLREIYNEQIEESRRRRAEVDRLLHEHLLTHNMQGEESGMNRENLRTTRLSNGLQVTYVDISGTGIRHGGPRFAIEAVKRHTQSLQQPDGADTDVLIFANDEFGPDGKPNGRKKLMIKIPKEHHGANRINVEELATRLNESEKLFGGGETLISVATYGGHNEVVLSPQFEGTELDTEKIFVGIQKYAELPRYSAEAFAHRARAFAEKLGTTNYSIKLDEPQNEYDIAQRAIVIARSNGGVVLIHEDELDLYESTFTESASDNTRIIEQKTEKSEAPEVVRKKIESARDNFQHALIEGNAPQILEALAYMPAHEIERMDEQTLFEIYDLIANDEVAISNIWNRDDNRFGIVGENVPDWMLNDPDEYKKGRFDYLSTVQSKIDKIITNKLYEYCSLRGNSELQSQFAMSLEKVLRSEAYKTSHQEWAYDKHLHMVLQYISDKKINKTARQMLSRSIGLNYGAGMAEHWQRIVDTSPDLLLAAIDEFPHEFEGIIDSVNFNSSEHRIAGVEESSKKEPKAEQIKQRLEEQRALGIHPPRLNLLIEIGRPIQSSLLSKEIKSLDSDSNPKTDTINDFDGVIKVKGFIKIGHDEVLLSAELLKQLQIVEDATADETEKPEIRIIFGSFPGPLQNEINTALSRPDEDEDRVDIGANLRSRLLICQYNQPKQEFYDKPYKKKKAA